MKRVFVMGVMALALTVATAALAATSGWKVQRSPNPSGATRSQLYGVSCASARSCIAVGEYKPGESVDTTLAERWRAGKWSIERIPSPGNAGGDLLAVSCTSSKACIAVGSYEKNGSSIALAERWNGKTWSVEKVPNPAGATGGFLQGVSCTSGDRCTAVGGVYHASGIGTLAERWNGKHWSVEHTPSPAGAVEPAFDGVSCTSAKACMAVGYYDNTTNAQATLAERWNGKHWSIAATSGPGGAAGSALSSVSCTAPGECSAVGHYETKNNDSRTLAERWNGKKWLIQKTQNPTSNPNKTLLGVSCTSAKSCTAAGDTSGPLVWYATLVEHWNGSKWSVQSSPHPGTDSQLQGVSCTSTSTCTAVGWYENNSSPQKTLVERR